MISFQSSSQVSLAVNRVPVRLAGTLLNYLPDAAATTRSSLPTAQPCGEARNRDRWTLDGAVEPENPNILWKGC